VRLDPRTRAAIVLLAVLAAGCSSGPVPQSAPPPPDAPTDTQVPAFVVGSSDSVSIRPGSPDAVFRYRFRQTEPGSEKFQFQDRDLSFYMRPTPAAIHFLVENRQDRPVFIDWDRSVFYDPYGRNGKVAHATTTWEERFKSTQATQITGLQRYSDYVFPMDFLVDPAGSGDQLHRPLFPEDSSALQFADRDFGVNLVFLIENQPRTYIFRFRVASIIPR
jgi:hypothetical protein